MTKLIELEWTAYQTIRDLEPAAYEELKLAVPQLNLGDDQSSYYFSGEVVMIEDEQEAIIAAVGLKYKVKSMAKLKLIEHVTSQVHVHVPSFGMLGIRHVIVLEDSCTNNLQIHLDEGWRILCVCPPLDKRRPDYILGRNDES